MGSRSQGRNTVVAPGTAPRTYGQVPSPSSQTDRSFQTQWSKFHGLCSMFYVCARRKKLTSGVNICENL